ncbi:hypothetical protein AB7C87_04245 [Natrarchaeobius sp. A-rgal3]|uniref:hypothetical protein n=1 Tax=Natrarchaeobius versutus TaxID=1679078 RepID=UPI00350EDB77
MTYQDRRTFMQTVGVGSLGALATGAAGTAAAETTITVDGGGYDVWNDYDEFHYYYAELDGDFDVAVGIDALEDTDEWAKAGLMIRGTLADDAAHALIRKTPGHDTSLQWRPTDGDDARSTTSDEGEDRSEVPGGTMAADYQRLVRDGDTIRAYGSSDGTSWTRIAELPADELDLAESAYVGLAVTSHDPGTLCTAEFSELSGLSPSANGDVGDVEVAGNVSESPSEEDELAVSTGSAADVDATSATLGGSLDDLGEAESADVSFEYRESGTGSWSATSPTTLSSPGSFSDGVSGLAAETDYEFRAVAEASDGDRDEGSINAFTTDEADEPGTFTVEGAGDDIWDDADEFHYYVTDVAGDFDVTVGIDDQEETDEWAKAGLMVRESLADDAVHALIRKTPGNETSVQWRPETGADAGSTTSDLGEGETEVPDGTMEADYQRLVREGDQLRAYGSSDGDDWTLIVELVLGEDLELPERCYLGAAVTSADAGTLCATQFVDLAGVEPTHSLDVGDPSVAGAVYGPDGESVDNPPLAVTGEVADRTEDGATLHGSLEALGGTDSVDVSFEYREAGAAGWTTTGSETRSSTGEFDEDVSGLDTDAEYEYRAVAVAPDGNRDEGVIATFATLAPDSDPVVETDGASNVSASSATLEGTLLDTGGHAESAEVSFEYREIGADDWTETDRETIADPIEDGEAFVRTVDELSAEIDYEFRAAAEADDGDADVGETLSFTTGEPDPTISTHDATGVTDSAATLNGEVDLGGAGHADCHFEYRETGADDWIETDDERLSSSGTFSRTVSDLSSQTDHEFRAIAALSTGDTHVGSISTFDTEETEPVADDEVTIGNIGADSPSSPIAPDDGFADTSWITDGPLAVIRVTTLEPEGEGSFKWACEVGYDEIDKEDAHGRLIVFEVGGVIDLEGRDIEAERKNIYVAGQTAPSPGITIIRANKPGVEFDEANHFVQHIRSCPGDQIGEPADPLVAGDDAFNLCFDHCTVFWGTEESMSVNAGDDSEDITFCNNLIAEPLFDSPVHGGDDQRAYATLFGNGMDTGAILGNLYAHTWSRNPRLKGGTEATVANNVWYDFERGMRIGDDQDDPNYVNVVENHYRVGDAADFDRPIVYTRHDESDPPIYIHHEGNEYHDDYTLIDTDDVWEIQDDRIDEYWPDGLTTMGGDPYEQVLSHAGARPAERIDHLEERIVAHVENRDGGIIDSQEEVGGYPELPSTYRELDIPDGDVTDWLRQHTRAVEVGDVDPPD